MPKPEVTKLRQTGLFWEVSKRTGEGNWVAVYTSAGGSRVKYVNLNKALTKEMKERAEEMSKEIEEDMYWP